MKQVIDIALSITSGETLVPMIDDAKILNVTRVDDQHDARLWVLQASTGMWRSRRILVATYGQVPDAAEYVGHYRREGIMYHVFDLGWAD